jgi:SSS family solute:Na+ symporter
MLATVMSTVDSYLFIGAQTLGHDIVWRLRQGMAAATSEVAGSGSNRWTRLALGVVAAGAIGIALSGLGVVEMWHHLGSIGTPALLVPMLSSLEPRWRMRPRFAATSIVLSGGLAAVWLTSAHGDGRYWCGIEPIFPALGMSVCLWVASRIATEQPT